MRKLILTQLMLLIFISPMIISCGDDDNPGPVVLVPELDGVYVFGSGTVAESAVDPNARMALATLNPAKSGGVETMAGYYAKYMHIDANSTIQITEVEGETAITYGAENGGTVTPGSELQFTDINDEFITGNLVADGAPIEISEEGLYYVFVNTIDETFRVMRVEPNLIGDATPGQWSTSTPLPMVHSSVDSTIFEITGLELRGESGYKVRFNEGYEVFNNNEIATLTFLGVEDYGAAWDSGINDLGFWDVNIPNKETGVYTYRLKYNAATGEWSETKVKDYSTTEMGLFGNAFMVDGVEANWNMGYGLHAPTKSGSVYTWSWENVDLIQDREFIFLEDGAWGGMQIDYTGATNEGAAITNEQIVDATTVGGEFHNYYVVEGIVYDITLEVDGATGSRIVTIAPSN